MSKLLLIPFAALVLSANTLCAKSVCPLANINKHADALNIEGGTIKKEKLRSDQVWVNLCAVLDKPFDEDVDKLIQATKEKNFPLKEAVIEDYNEPQVNFAFTTIIKYYADHAHEVIKKTPNHPVKIVAQIHRNRSGPAHLMLLEHILNDCYPQLKGKKSTSGFFDPSTLFSYTYHRNVEVEFRFGNIPGRNYDYSDADIVISLSLVAALNPSYNAGDLVVADEFIPMPLSTMQMDKSHAYKAQNNLLTNLDDIIRSQDRRAIRLINQNHRSANPEKRGKYAKVLKKADFRHARIVQVDRTFNPKQLPKAFEIIEKGD